MNKKLVEFLKLEGSITRKDVEQAFLDTPRHLFVPKNLLEEAYYNYPLPIGYDATISQPSIVANMTELLNPQKNHVILEIGTGSGWQAAILSRLVNKVYSIEVIPELVEQAKKNLEKLKIKNLEVKFGQGADGWVEHAPYDGIIVTAAASQISPAWVEQLKVGGRIVAPVGWPFQTMILAEKTKTGVKEKQLYPCMFVPLKT